MTTGRIPYLPVVVAFCFAAILGYAGFSVYVVFYLRDATMTGDVVGTWKSFAVLAFGYWIGSSSGGKSQPSAEHPTPVEVTNVPGNPVPTVAEKPKGKPDA